jgi:putative membrane protein
MRRIILASAVALAVPVLSGSPVLSPAALAAPAATPTETFVTTVAISDMFEVEAGRLAASKAANAKVKSFGQMMVDDHSKTTNDLKALIDDKKVEAKLPASLDQDHQAKLDKLKDLSGDAFDRAYIPTQVSGHEKAVDLFQNYADTGENADLKQWAQKTLPTLKGHLDEAKQLSSEIKMAADDTDQQAGRKEKQVDVTVDTEKGAEVRVETKQRKDRAASFDYVPRQKPTEWTAQALIGRTVENDKGDNLGDINNVILNERGQVVAVTIGVGGFLGMGEKNVGVPFQALDFKLDTDRSDLNKRSEGPAEKKAEREARFDTEHSNVQIVLNASKEELEAAPEFVWLDQQNADNARNERTVQ